MVIMEAEKPHIHPQQDGDPGEAVVTFQSECRRLVSRLKAVSTNMPLFNFLFNSDLQWAG